MIAVLFEVTLQPERRSTYLDLAAQLRAELETMEGFISIERFQSLAHPNKLLSLSFWQDEAAVARWRNRPEHRSAQIAGRHSMFSDYRLRVASVQRDYGLHERAQAPADARAMHG
jgi:heme-degrading monooxygenase HmoA